MQSHGCQLVTVESSIVNKPPFLHIRSGWAPLDVPFLSPPMISSRQKYRGATSNAKANNSDDIFVDGLGKAVMSADPPPQHRPVLEDLGRWDPADEPAELGHGSVHTKAAIRFLGGDLLCVIKRPLGQNITLPPTSSTGATRPGIAAGCLFNLNGCFEREEAQPWHVQHGARDGQNDLVEGVRCLLEHGDLFGWSWDQA